MAFCPFAYYEHLFFPFKIPSSSGAFLQRQVCLGRGVIREPAFEDMRLWGMRKGVGGIKLKLHENSSVYWLPRQAPLSSESPVPAQPGHTHLESPGCSSQFKCLHTRTKRTIVAQLLVKYLRTGEFHMLLREFYTGASQ